MRLNRFLEFSNNVAVCHVRDDEPHKHSTYRDVGTLLEFLVVYFLEGIVDYFD